MAEHPLWFFLYSGPGPGLVTLFAVPNTRARGFNHPGFNVYLCTALGYSHTKVKTTTLAEHQDDILQDYSDGESRTS